MIDNKTYEKVEGILYSYYKKIKRIKWIENNIVMNDDAIVTIRNDLKTVNVDLETSISGIDYSRDIVQSSFTMSSVEKELERITDKLMDELKYRVQKRYRLKNRKRQIEEDVKRIQIILSELSDEKLQIIELKYNRKMYNRQIAQILHCDESTIGRKKDKLIEYISRELKMY